MSSFSTFLTRSASSEVKKKATRKIRETRPENRRFIMKQTVLIRFDCVQTSMYKVYGNTYFKIKITCDVRC